MSKTANTSLRLTLSGGDISPQNVRMETLFGVLGGLERALEAMCDELGVEFDEHESIVLPESLHDSSLAIPTQVNAKAAGALAEIDRAFYREEFDGLPENVRGEFLDIQSTLDARGSTLKTSSDTEDLHGFTLSADTPHIPEPGEDDLEMTSHAVVYGICVRINRQRHDASVRLHNGEICRLDALSDAQLQELMSGTGRDLEQVYRIEGQATWQPDDYRIRRLEVSSLECVERDAEKFFDALRDEDTDRFEGVDPIDYVDKLRGK